MEKTHQEYGRDSDSVFSGTGSPRLSWKSVYRSLHIFAKNCFILLHKLTPKSQLRDSHEFFVSSTAAKRPKWELPGCNMVQRYTNAPQVNCSGELLARRSLQHSSLIHVWILKFAHANNDQH